MKRKFGFLRMLFCLFGLSWLASPERPMTDEERERWRERRHRFRKQVREAAREFLAEDGSEA
jgi:hypothetical protein